MVLFFLSLDIQHMQKPIDCKCQIREERLANLDDVWSAGELMLICTVFQSTLVQELNVNSLNQDKRAQISAGHTSTTPTRI